MRSIKKVLAIIFICLLVFSAMQIGVCAQEEKTDAITVTDVETEAAEQESAVWEDTTVNTQAAEANEPELVHAASVGSVIGTVLGAIVFLPCLLIDLIVWVFSGFNVHIFYSHLFG